MARQDFDLFDAGRRGRGGEEIAIILRDAAAPAECVGYKVVKSFLAVLL